MGYSSTTMVFDTATGMLPATAGQTTSYVLNCSAPGSGLAATRSNEVCFQYFDQKPGHTLQDQDPALYHIFAKYGTNITVDKNNGNCASRGYTSQIEPGRRREPRHHCLLLPPLKCALVRILTVL